MAKGFERMGPSQRFPIPNHQKKPGTLLKKCIATNPRRPINPTAAVAAAITALQTSFVAKLVLEDLLPS